jgi:hypothetical protein
MYGKLIFGSLMALLWTQPVMAYIDPGSGSAIMSAIIGLFVAIGVTGKTYWYKIKSIFTGKKSQQNSDDDPSH